MRFFPGTKAKREILLQAKPSPTKLVSVARVLDTAIKSMDPTWVFYDFLLSLEPLIHMCGTRKHYQWYWWSFVYHRMFSEDTFYPNIMCIYIYISGGTIYTTPSSIVDLASTSVVNS